MSYLNALHQYIHHLKSVDREIQLTMFFSMIEDNYDIINNY